MNWVSLVGRGFMIYVHGVDEEQRLVWSNAGRFGLCHIVGVHFQWFWSSSPNFGIDYLVDFGFSRTPVLSSSWDFGWYSWPNCPNHGPLLPTFVWIFSYQTGLLANFDCIFFQTMYSIANFGSFCPNHVLYCPTLATFCPNICLNYVISITCMCHLDYLLRSFCWYQDNIYIKSNGFLIIVMYLECNLSMQKYANELS